MYSNYLSLINLFFLILHQFTSIRIIFMLFHHNLIQLLPLLCVYFYYALLLYY